MGLIWRDNAFEERWTFKGGGMQNSGHLFTVSIRNEIHKKPNDYEVPCNVLGILRSLESLHLVKLALPFVNSIEKALVRFREPFRGCGTSLLLQPQIL